MELSLLAAERVSFWDDGKEHCGVVLLTVADPELRETDENYLPRLSGITRCTEYFLK